MSGRMSDASADQLSNKAKHGEGNSGMYQLTGELKKAGIDSLFFNWNGTSAGHYNDKVAPGAKAIVAAIHSACEKNKKLHLVLVGHSWGGHTMLEVATRLNSEPVKMIDLAIGIDPSSFGLDENPKQLPPNIRRLVYFHTRNAFVWPEWKGEKRVDAIDLGDPKRGFMKKGSPNYAAPFDFDAHNAIEWDERVHSEVVSLIKKTIAKMPVSPKQSEKNLPTTSNSGK